MIRYSYTYTFNLSNLSNISNLSNLSNLNNLSNIFNSKIDTRVEQLRRIAIENIIGKISIQDHVYYPLASKENSGSLSCDTLSSRII